MHRTQGVPIVVMNRDVNSTSRSIKDEILRRGGDPRSDLLVRSEFMTIQGEGPYAGEPAYFVRLGGCNFGSKHEYCQGCDTSFEVEHSELVHVADLAARIKALPKTAASQPKLVVITGGEPLLQAKACAALAEAIAFDDKGEQFLNWIQFETNGSLLSRAVEDFEKCSPEAFDLLSFVVSPKASVKGYPDALMKDLVLMAQAHEFTNLYFKFVVDADPASSHHELPKPILDFAAEEAGSVFVSPFTVYAKPYSGEVSSVWDAGLIDNAQTEANYAYAAQYVLAHPGLRLSVQMHTFLGIA